MRHSEIALQLLLGVAATLVSDHHHGVIVETRPATNDRRVVAVGPISVELDEIRECELDVVGGEWPPWIAGDLNALKRSEVLVDFFAQIFELPLEGLDRFRDAELAVARRLLDFVDLPLQLGDRLLELKLCRRCHQSTPPLKFNGRLA